MVAQIKGLLFTFIGTLKQQIFSLKEVFFVTPLTAFSPGSTLRMPTSAFSSSSV